jgi:hypothetical protein
LIKASVAPASAPLKSIFLILGMILKPAPAAPAFVIFPCLFWKKGLNISFPANLTALFGASAVIGAIIPKF